MASYNNEVILHLNRNMLNMNRSCIIEYKGETFS